MAHRELNPTPDTTHRMSVPKPEAQIRLLFEKFQAFVDEYRPKISLGGVFIATAQPKPVGTTISCEFRLADGFRLCRALGDVLWVRPQATAPDRPSGMGIRFSAIDDEGRKLILKILEEQVRSGGEPFEVERLPGDVVTSRAVGPAGARVPEPREDPASTHRRSPPVPTPREDPASTYARKAVTPLEQEAFSDSAGPFAAVKPLDELVVEQEPADFNAPWGVALPGIPEEVIEPVDEEAVMTSLDEDFASDPKEAAFPAAGDADFFDLPSSEGDPAFDGLPEFEIIEEEPVDDPSALREWAPEAPQTAPEARDELFGSAAFPDLDEPLGPDALSPGPSLAGLDDTLPRSLPDDGSELARPRPSAGGAPASVARADGPRGSLQVGPDLDEPLTPADGGLTVPEWPPATTADPMSFPSDPDDDMAAGPVSGLGLGPTEIAALTEGVSADDSWWSSDADDEWEEEVADSRFKTFVRDLELTVSESKGRILAVATFLVIVVVAVVFREQVLGLVGLGSEGELGPTSSMPGAEPEESSSVPGEALPVAPEEPGGSDGGVSDSSAAVDDPAAASSGGPEPQETVPPTPEPASTPEPIARPVPPPRLPPPDTSAAAEARSVRDIECEQTPQGTKCVVSFDGRLAPDRYEHNSLGYDPLKEQIVILGIESPYRMQRIDVGTLELDRIRTGYDRGQLRLVFDLSSERMTLSSFEPRAGRLEVVVSRRR